RTCQLGRGLRRRDLAQLGRDRAGLRRRHVHPPRRRRPREEARGRADHREAPKRADGFGPAQLRARAHAVPQRRPRRRAVSPRPVRASPTGAGPSNATPRRVRTILNRLRGRFGELVPPRAADPLDELMLTVLSQHTSDVNADRAFTSLRDAFPTWSQVVAAPEASLADAIRSGGLANTKAPRIQAILREVHEREGAYDLSRL